MKEFFDQLLDEAARRELPQPAELRARGDRRVARRAAAGAFSLAVVIAAGFIAARPLFHEQSNIADGIISASPAPNVPQPIAVPNVVGLSRTEAITVLQQQGFKVQVKAASPPPSGSPQAGKVSQQDPVAAKRTPGETITIYIDDQEPACADKWPKALLAGLFVKADNEICYAETDAMTAFENLPVPCAPKVLASESLVEDRRGYSGVFDTQVERVHYETVLSQTISKYKGNGAKDYVLELAGDIANCKSVTRGVATLDYRLVPQPPENRLGEQSLVIEGQRRFLKKPETGPQTENFLVSVVRVGLYVIVVYDKGWEGASKAENTVFDTAREMLRRLTASPSPAR